MRSALAQSEKRSRVDADARKEAGTYSQPAQASPNPEASLDAAFPVGVVMSISSL